MIRSDDKYRHVVIIAYTQFGDPEQEEKLLALGANDFVYKPTTPKIVEIRVRNALKRIRKFNQDCKRNERVGEICDCYL